MNRFFYIYYYLLPICLFWSCSSPPVPEPSPPRVTIQETKSPSVIPPSPPDKVPIISVKYDKDKMVILWKQSKASDFKEYVLFQKLKDGSIDTIEIVQNIADTVFQLHSFDPRIENWFWVNVKSKADLVAIGDRRTHELEIRAPAPTKIFPIEYSKAIRIRWEKNLDIDFNHYTIYQSKNPDMDNNKIAQKVYEKDDTTFFLPMDSAFYYQIGVVDHWGLESYSNIVLGDYFVTIMGKDYSLLETKEFDLSSSSLFGDFPKEIFKLLNLEVLRLQNNFITGGLPDQLWEMSYLRVINLSDNQLTGVIPGDIHRLKNMEEIWLSNNQFSGHLPYQIFSLKNLTHLNLSSNKLSGNLSEAVGNLQHLVYLNLWDNDISGTIPRDIGDLSKLEFLSLGKNKIRGTIPTEIGNVKSLVSLALFENKLEGSIPNNLTELPNLKYLGLFSNNLIGYVPDYFMDNSNLRYLRLDKNNLTEIDHDAMCGSGYNWDNFIYYDVSNNSFNNTLPVCFESETLRKIYVESFKN